MITIVLSFYILEKAFDINFISSVQNSGTGLKIRSLAANSKMGMK